MDKSLLLAVFTMAACGAAGQGAPNAPDQRPAFPGQTRAPERASNVAIDVATVAGGLDNPMGTRVPP